MKFLVFAIVCFSVALATDDDFCTERNAGYYADPDDCSKYYQCDDFHKTHHRTCSEQLKWSAVKNICDHAADVDCDRKPLEPLNPTNLLLHPPLPYTRCDLHCQTRNPDGSCTVAPNWRIENSMCVDTTYCLSLPNGHYHDPRNCSRFYQCDAFHKAFLHSCPSGLKWSVTKTTCDWPRYVDCNRGGEPYKPPFGCGLRDPRPVKFDCIQGFLNGARLYWNKLLFTDRDPSSNVYSGIAINWGNWKAYVNGLACRCAKAAYTKGYKYFGLQFYGECWSGPYYGAISASHVTNPDNCLQEYFQKCKKLDTTHACVGKAWNNYVYRVLPPKMMK